jgi:CRISPR system Cascade subunit CasC
MTLPRFLQVHFLTPFAGVLLNRDDAGLAKRLTYGGTVRTRVSSQSLKRHWRTAADAHGLAATGAPLAVRSRELVEYEVLPRLAERASSVPEAVRIAAGAALSRALYGKKADDPRKRQALLLGWRELEYLTNLLVDLLAEPHDEKSAAAAVEAAFKDPDSKGRLSVIRESAGNLAAGLEAALFGRMITSDPAANTDAALHVAHAFTVHEQESETDYFTVVDDLTSADDDADAGSAGIFDTELTSGLFYGYVVVDVPLLVANLTGRKPSDWDKPDTDRTLAAKVVEHLVHVIATVSPGAKRGSTAPYSYASTMLIEAGDRQPRSLASAFEASVRAPRDVPISVAAEARLIERLEAMDRAYGAGESRRGLSVTSATLAGSPALPLTALAEWAAERVATASI